MVDFGASDKMIKISWKIDDSNTYNGFSGNISFFIDSGTSSDESFFAFFYILANWRKIRLMGNVNRYKGKERV